MTRLYRKMNYKDDHDKWVRYVKPRYHASKKVREMVAIKNKRWLDKLKKDKKAYAVFRAKKLKYLVNYRLKQK